MPRPAPAIGTVEEGFRFLGGNPASPTSWEPAASPLPLLGASARSMVESATQAGREYAKGAAKSGASTLLNLGENLFRGVPFLGPMARESAATLRPSLERETDIEKLGAFSEQAAELLAPGGPIVRGAARIKSAVSGAGPIARTARALTRPALEGASTGAITTAQTGSSTEGAVAGGAVAGLGATGALLPKAKDIAVKMYGHALKIPPSAFNHKEVQEILDEAMRSKVTLGPEALSTVRGLIDQINKETETKIAQGAARGLTVEPKEVVKSVKHVMNFARNMANPKAPTASIRGVISEFLESHTGMRPPSKPVPTGLVSPSGQPIMGPGRPPVPPQPIPIDKAQKIAQSTGLGLHFGEMTASFEKEALKGIRHGLKQGIYKHFPELKPAAQREKWLIDLESMIDRFANRELNKNVVSIDMPIFAGSAAILGGSPEAGLIAGFFKHVVDKSPDLASRIAIKLSQGAPKMLTGPVRGVKTGAAFGVRSENEQ